MSEWHLDRLPGEVRREAENAAQREGLPLHRWLANTIRDICIAEGVEPARELSRPSRDGMARAKSDRTVAAIPLMQVAPARSSSAPRAVAPPPPEPEPTPEAEPASPPPAPPRQTSRFAARLAELREANRQNADHQINYQNGERYNGRAAPAPSQAAPAAAPNRPSGETRRFPTRPPEPPQAAASSSGDERQALLAQLVHSLRHNELSPLGEARIYLKLMTEHMASITDITVATGRTREQVSQTLRLLGLSDRLRDLIDKGGLSRDQAYALLDSGDPEAMLADLQQDKTAVGRRAP